MNKSTGMLRIIALMQFPLHGLGLLTGCVVLSLHQPPSCGASVRRSRRVFLRVVLFAFALYCSAYGNAWNDTVNGIRQFYSNSSAHADARIELLNHEVFAWRNRPRNELLLQWRELKSAIASGSASFPRNPTLGQIDAAIDHISNHIQPWLGRLERATQELLDRCEQDVSNYRNRVQGLHDYAGQFMQAFERVRASDAYQELIEQPIYSIDAGLRAQSAVETYIAATIDAMTQIAEALEASAEAYQRGARVAADERLAMVNYGGTNAVFYDVERVRAEHRRLDSIYGRGQAAPDYMAFARGNSIDFHRVPPDVSADLMLYRRASAVVDEMNAFTPEFRQIEFLDLHESAELVQRYRVLRSQTGKKPEISPAMERFLETQAAGAISLNLHYEALSQARKEENGQLSATRLIEFAPALRRMRQSIIEHRDISASLLPALMAEAQALYREYAGMLRGESSLRIERLTGFTRLMRELGVAESVWEELSDKALQFEQSRLRAIEELASGGDDEIRKLADLLTLFDRRLAGQVQNSSYDELMRLLAEINANQEVSLNKRVAIARLRCTLAPDDSELQLNLAWYLEASGRYSDAEPIYMRLRETAPEAEHLILAHALNLDNQGDTDAAEALFRDMLADTQSVELSTVQMWLRFAHRQGRLAEALQGWEEAFAVRGEQEAFYRMLMYAHTYAGDFRAATMAFESLPEGTKTSEDWEHYVRLGLSSEDVYARAMRAMSEAPDTLEHRASLAFARLGKGRTEEARELLDAIGLDNTPWYLLVSWILFADMTGSEDLSARLDAMIEAIEGAEERDLMRAYRLVAKGDYGAAATLLQPHEWPAYPYLRFLRARAALGLGDRDTALAMLDKLDDEVGFEFLPAITVKYQLQVLTGDRAEAGRTLVRLDGASASDCPIRTFYHCLYETRFGSRQEAMRLKNEVLTAYPDGLAGIGGVWNILPESLALFDQAGAIPAKVWVFVAAGLLLAVLLAFGLLRIVRSRKSVPS